LRPFDEGQPQTLVGMRARLAITERRLHVRMCGPQSRKVADHAIRRPLDALPRIGYGAIQATFRAGAKPTGTSATSFMEAMSTTETLFVCELAT
jgi:hypothetical protein